MLTALGHRGLDGEDWSEAPARYLVRHQLDDGSWPAPAGADPAGRRLAETAYAVLVLASSRTPVAMNKLYYPSTDGGTGGRNPAAARQRDAAHLLEWSGWELRRPLNWQWVTLDDSDGLAQAPILSISGGQSVEFSPRDLGRLRAYVEHGGMILGNANCGSQRFADSFVRLGRQLFPRYEFRTLPDDHVLFSGQKFDGRAWRGVPPVRGLSNGVRELMLLPDGDASFAWQVRTYVRPPWFQVGFDLLSYVQEPTTWPRRGDRVFPVRSRRVRAKATVRVARLMIGDNPDPEPGGWERLANLMHNRFQTDLDVSAVRPGDGALARAKNPFRVAHLTGTTKLALSPEARDEVRQFVDAGGTLVVEAAGGSKEFAESAPAELRATLPRSGGIVGPKAGGRRFPIANGQINRIPLPPVRARPDARRSRATAPPRNTGW